MSKYPWKITQRVQSYQSRWNQRTDEGTFRTLLASLGLFPVSIWTFWRNNEFKILSVISFIFLNTGKDKCRTSLLPEVSVTFFFSLWPLSLDYFCFDLILMRVMMSFSSFYPESRTQQLLLVPPRHIWPMSHWFAFCFARSLLGFRN